MSDRSPEIDCNCSNCDNHGGYKVCLDCGRKYIAVADGPDDFIWEEVEA